MSPFATASSMTSEGMALSLWSVLFVAFFEERSLSYSSDIFFRVRFCSSVSPHRFSIFRTCSSSSLRASGEYLLEFTRRLSHARAYLPTVRSLGLSTPYSNSMRHSSSARRVSALMPWMVFLRGSDVAPCLGVSAEVVPDAVHLALDDFFDPACTGNLRGIFSFASMARRRLSGRCRTA